MRIFSYLFCLAFPLSFDCHAYLFRITSQHSHRNNPDIARKEGLYSFETFGRCQIALEITKQVFDACRIQHWSDCGEDFTLSVVADPIQMLPCENLYIEEKKLHNLQYSNVSPAITRGRRSASQPLTLMHAPLLQFLSQLIFSSTGAKLSPPRLSSSIESLYLFEPTT